MTDGLLYKKDTDFVRDNMLINYCLGDDESLLIESFVRNNGICLRFDVGRFYFFMTGTHKKFVTGYTPCLLYTSRHGGNRPSLPRG